MVIIKDLFAKRKYHYTPTYVSLRTNPFQTMKTKRPLTGLMRIKTEDLFLIQEVQSTIRNSFYDAFVYHIFLGSICPPPSRITNLP